MEGGLDWKVEERIGWIWIRTSILTRSTPGGVGGFLKRGATATAYFILGRDGRALSKTLSAIDCMPIGA